MTDSPFIALLPCPFCGGPATDYSQTQSWLGCKKCGAEIGIHRTKAEAAEVWNRRAAMGEREVRVKPLTWHGDVARAPHGDYYRVQQSEGPWNPGGWGYRRNDSAGLTLGPKGGILFADKEDAMRGVEVDYEARIRSALEVGEREVTVSALNFCPGTEPPDTPKGSCRTFIVTVRRNRLPEKAFTFAACYLNAYPLDWNDGDGCGDCPDDGSHDDGCPMTGWMTDRFHPDYDGYYEHLLGDGDELIEWAALPDRSRALASEPTP